MKYAARLATILFAGFCALAGPQVSVGQGGHGGGGGHGFGGHSGGHSAHGLSAGKTSGHGPGRSIGHSVVHFFGGHGKSSASLLPSASNLALVNSGTVPRSNPNIVVPPRLHPRPRMPGEAFVPSSSFAFCHRSHFGFDGCSSLSNRSFWRTDVACFDSGFFFDPFFLWGGPSYDFPASERAFIRRASAPIVASQDRSNSIEGKGNDAENAPEKSEAHTTSLVLQDGSEFGLTEYWLVGDELSYVTTYGGRNSLPVQRIDLEKTLKLNAERGVKFVLRPKPAQPR